MTTLVKLNRWKEDLFSVRPV